MRHLSGSLVNGQVGSRAECQGPWASCILVAPLPHEALGPSSLKFCFGKLWFYLFITIYIAKSFRRLPVNMDSSCAKTPSSGLSDQTAHGLVSSNQRASRHDVIMARQKQPVSSYYGTCPFKLTISYNSFNTNSITVHSGSNDGKNCHIYVNTSALFLHKELTKSHSIPGLDTGCARYRAESHTLY